MQSFKSLNTFSLTNNELDFQNNYFVGYESCPDIRNSSLSASRNNNKINFNNFYRTFVTEYLADGSVEARLCILP